ncbi:T-cell surface antigen CD2 [Ctenodactylus gundi]
MRASYESLTSFLLIFSFSIKGAISTHTGVVWGALGQDIHLQIPGFHMSAVVDDIRWDKGETKVAQFRKGKGSAPLHETYEIFPNGTLRIKDLKRNHSSMYHVAVYNTDGKLVLEKTFDLKVLVYPFTFVNQLRLLAKDTAAENPLKVAVDGEEDNYFRSLELRSSHLREGLCVLNSLYTQTLMHHRVLCSLNLMKRAGGPAALLGTSYQQHQCKEKSARKGIDLYVLLGICGGGVLLLVFVVLVIFYISKRKRQNSRRCDEGMEISTHRATTKEGARKPSQAPVLPTPTPAASQTPPPPSHRSQGPRQQPLPPTHRVLQRPQRRPPPSGSQVHQQKGPPLPKPRVQQKPPHGMTENSLSPASN